MIKKYQKKVLNKATGRYVNATFYEVHKMIDGKRYHKRGFKTKAEAAEYELLIENKGKELTNNALTVGELYNLYHDHLKNSGCKLRSIQEYEKIWDKHLKESFDAIRICDLNLARIKKWQDELLSFRKKNNEGYKNRTLEKIQTLLKSILYFGVRNGYTDKIIPFNYIKNKSEAKKEMDYYTPEEFNKFISVIDHTVYRALFIVLYFCGIRKGEALGLFWKDIDFEKKEMAINKTYDPRNHIVTVPKTRNSYRKIALPDRVVDALIELKDYYSIGESDSDKFVFGYFKPISANAIDSANRKYSRKAGVKRIRIHDFRHSHVSALVNQGFSPFDIAKRLGHTPEMVNNIYGHWFLESQSKMIDYLNTI